VSVDRTISSAACVRSELKVKSKRSLLMIKQLLDDFPGRADCRWRQITGTIAKGIATHLNAMDRVEVNNFRWYRADK
jgi:hypothetical protein